VVKVLASVIERDGAVDVGATLLDPLAYALRDAELRVSGRRAATAADVAGLGSTWAKRLGIPERRTAWMLTAQR
jgi:hypothetical protein